MSRCVIFGAGSYDAFKPEIGKDDFVIAADGGIRAAMENDIAPDLIIGDFDSFDGPLPEGIPAVTLPVKKDVTDMDAAVEQGLKRGYKSFVLLGGTGGRPDHSFANYSLIARLSENGIKALLYGENYIITALTDGSLYARAPAGATVSVFSFSDISEGVSIEGLKYELKNKPVSSSFALGVSNSFIGETAKITVTNGTLIIMAENSAVFFYPEG